jgi:starch-binding outer membrane protein, SusD/RagB family
MRGFVMRAAKSVSAMVAFAALAGCSALDVNAPNAIRLPDVENPQGASLAVSGIRLYMRYALEMAILKTGSLTDEFGTGDGNDMLNLRSSEFPGELYYWLQTVYGTASKALPIIRSAEPHAPQQLGEAFALRGYALLGLAETICPGFSVVGFDIQGEAITPRFDSDPQTADSGFNRALTDFDSALAHTSDGTPAKYLAQVGKGRALLGLGRFAEAVAAVAGVPTTFQDTIRSGDALYFSFDALWNGGYPVQDREGTNGLDFVSAHDPRVVLVDRNGDGSAYSPEKYYANNNTLPAMMLASGVEARLIEAEGELATAPDGPEWLATLNTLRATAGLSDTTDPGTTTARVDLLFRERAFWLFGTAHRVGDLRRLIARYGRAADSVFPVGPNYGTATSISFDATEEHVFNPKITGCIDL